MADPRSRAARRAFYGAWLELEELDTLDKDAAANKGFTADLGPLLRQEIDLFLDEVLDEGDGKLTTLLTADFTFANPMLSAAYELPAVTGTAFQRVTVDAAQRPGILTRAGMMAALAKPDQSSPVRRGGFVRERLLCQDLPLPPNDIDVTAPKVTPGTTTKERFAQHTESSACRSCHLLIDPIGFGFENFDAVGRWRDQDQGRPVDASGEVIGTDDANGAYRGPAELIGKLARSGQVARCAVTLSFRHAQARGESADDACALGGLFATFEASGRDLARLPLQLVQTDAFLHRTPAP
jgi:hypothetical protein